MELIEKAKQIFDQVRAIEAKQEEVRNKMYELKRSIFAQLNKQLTEQNIDRFSDVRFYAFRQFLGLVIKSNSVKTRDIAAWPEMLDLMQANGRPGVTEWLTHWFKKGRMFRRLNALVEHCEWSLPISPVVKEEYQDAEDPGTSQRDTPEPTDSVVTT